MKDKLWFGAAYYPEYLPNRPIEEDMHLMKEAGINLIRVAESTWSTWEPRDGEFDFSILKNVLETAPAYGLSVIVGTPTYAIPPGWPGNTRTFCPRLTAAHAAMGIGRTLT